MNYGPLIFVGLLFTMIVSWYGIIYKNFLEVGRIEPMRNDLTGTIYPGGRSGLAQEGLEVYRAHNCASCHTMQVRASGVAINAQFNKPGVQTNFVYQGPDIQRGWGVRPTVLADFAHDNAVFLGQVRIGPDLANVGSRLPDEQYHLTHLYQPRATVKNSTMPPYPFLFEKRKIGVVPSPEALRLTGEYAPPAGYEIVPKREAKALVAYLTSLRAEEGIFSAPLPTVATNKTETASTDSSPAAAGDAQQ